MSFLVVSILSIGIFAYSLTWFLVPVCISFARYFNIFDNPDGVLKMHKMPTPYLGGIAVFFGTLVPAFFVIPFQSEALWMILGLVILVIVGLIDDLKVLRPHQKLFGQFVAVICFLCGGFYIHPTMCSHLCAISLSGLWMLTIINAFNLVDVMDGLACTIALCSSLGFLCICLFLQHLLGVLVFAAFVGSLLALLYYNKPVATIYLGDAGSLFIGGLLAALPLGLNLGKYSNLGYLAPVFVLSLPLIELISLIVIRLYKRLPFYKGSPDHFSIYLQSNGWNKKSILKYCIACMLATNLLAILLLLQLCSLIKILILSAFLVVCWVAILMLHIQFLPNFLKT